MPVCKTCKTKFEGPYRQKYCSIDCQFLFNVPRAEDDQRCWNWTGARIKAGYGLFNRRMPEGSDLLYAHRFSYELFHGKIGAGLFVCHRCDNPSCVNPAHLFSGSHQDNVNDAIQKGRFGMTGKKHKQESKEKMSDKHRGITPLWSLDKEFSSMVHKKAWVTRRKRMRERELCLA